MTPNLHSVIATATNIFKGINPFPNVRLPQPLSPGFPKRDWIVSALWTRDGLKPRWQRLAAIANTLSHHDDIDLWKRVLQELSIPLGIFTLADNCFVLSRAKSSEVKAREVAFEGLGIELAQYREELFSPRALSWIQSGQLSFSDMEETISDDGFYLLLRHRAQLDAALEDAIKGALHPYLARGIRHRRRDNAIPYFESVLVVTVAYLGARILEDKGFFGPTHTIARSPTQLLQETIKSTNGFFHRASRMDVENLDSESLQQLFAHLGPSVAFSLVDHHDVGRLYEKAQSILQRALASLLRSAAGPEKDASRLQVPLLKLQQHYTPIAVADEMLRHLPLERLEPDERVVFDPAAGSGSLLLAASRRLASLDDTPLGAERKGYLSHHVAGNDIDSLASSVTRLRYVIEQESIGSADLFPMPDFFERDFRDFTKQSLPVKARVIVANPPFAEEVDVQRAAEFVELVLTWLSDGDQFAFVLPGVFLTGSSHGIREARNCLSKRCKVFESWRFPEGIVGLTVRQTACVVIGEVGNKSDGYGVARAILSSAKKEAITDKGFLGQSWIVHNPTDADWRGLVAPHLTLKVRTVSLGSIFHVFSGVTRDKKFPPIDHKPPNVEVKRYWQLAYKGRGRLWADPDAITRNRYIRYGKEYLEGARLHNKELFDHAKVLVGRSVNINSEEPLVARLDTTGFCPANDVFCICTIESTGKKTQPSETPVGWNDLNDYDRLVWLTGLLNSEMAFDLSVQGRDPRHLSLNLLKGFPLPASVDTRIIQVAGAMVERDKKRQPIPYPDSLRKELNDLVEESYGRPYRLKLIRTGVVPDLALWEHERTHPSQTVIGQVLDCSSTDGKILLHLNGLLDEDQEAWLPHLPQLPGWALDGTAFEAHLSKDIRTFADLKSRPWALRQVKHTPHPYKSLEELEYEFIASIGSQ